MYCNKCGKNPAVVHYSKIVNNNITEMHLCEQCAQEQGISMKNQFSISNLLAGITDDIESVFQKQIKQELKCEVCGFKYSDFKKTGRLGCANCYNVFKDILRNLLKRIHGSEQHIGKIPEDLSEELKLSKEIIDLKTQLKEAVAKEDFEKAALLRDKIADLEK